MKSSLREVINSISAEGDVWLGAEEVVVDDTVLDATVVEIELD